MKKILSYVLIIIFTLVFALSGTCRSIVYAKSLSNNKDDLDKLEKMENEIKKELAGLNGEVTRASADLVEAQIKLEEVIIKVEECENNIVITRKRVVTKRDMMKKRIKYTYENPGAKSLFEIILCCRSIADILNIREYVKAVALYDEKVINDYNSEINKLEEEKKELEDLQREQEERKKALEKEKELLLKKVSEANSNLSGAREEIEKLEKIIKEMEEYERQMAIVVKPSAVELKPQSDSAPNEVTVSAPARPLVGEEEILAAIIYCEAGNEPYEGMLAVGSVVLNRVRDSRFPNTITEVVYAPGQFTPVQSGRFALSIENGLVSEQAKQAAAEVLAGNIIGSWLYFRRDDGTKQGDVISRQVFY